MYKWSNAETYFRHEYSNGCIRELHSHKNSHLAKKPRKSCQQTLTEAVKLWRNESGFVITHSLEHEVQAQMKGWKKLDFSWANMISDFMSPVRGYGQVEEDEDVTLKHNDVSRNKIPHLGVPEFPKGNNTSCTDIVQTLRTWVEDGVSVNGVHHIPVSEWTLEIRDREWRASCSETRKLRHSKDSRVSRVLSAYLKTRLSDNGTLFQVPYIASFTTLYKGGKRVADAYIKNHTDLKYLEGSACVLAEVVKHVLNCST